MGLSRPTRRKTLAIAGLAFCGAVWWFGTDEPADCRVVLRRELLELSSQTHRPDFKRRLRELAKRLDDCAESLRASSHGKQKASGGTREGRRSVEQMETRKPKIEPDLSEARLSRANLSGADLWLANLSGAALWRANLSRAALWSTNLKSSPFLWRKLWRRQPTVLEGAKFTGAWVLGVKFNRWARYRGILLEGCHGSPRFIWFARDQDFIEEFRSSFWRFPAYLIWLIFADCGRSLLLWAAWSLVLAVFFANKFHELGQQAFKVSDLGFGWDQMLYYSVVTFTTLGFGDITPRTQQAAWWVMGEVITGYVMLGGLISIFATKLARRSLGDVESPRRTR